MNVRIASTIVVLGLSWLFCRGDAVHAQARDKKSEAAGKLRLRYEGKTFAEYRELLLTDIDAAERVKNIKAMAALARHGLAENMTAALLEMMREFDDILLVEERQLETGVLPRDSLVVGLGHDDQKVFQESAAAVTRFAPITLPLLRKALREQKGRGVQMFVLDSIATMGAEGKDALPEVLVLASSKNTLTRATAMYCLSTIAAQDPRTSTSIFAALKDKSPLVRWGGLSAIIMMPELAKKSAPAILDAVKDPLCFISFEPILALKMSDAKARAIPALLGVIRRSTHPKVGDVFVGEYPTGNVDPKLVTQVYEYLYALGPAAKEAVPALIERLDYWKGVEDARVVRRLVYTPLPNGAQLGTQGTFRLAQRKLPPLPPKLLPLIPPVVPQSFQVPAPAPSPVPVPVPPAERDKIRKNEETKLVSFEQPLDEFLLAVDTLGAIGPAAKEALPALRKLAESESGERRTAIADAIQLIEQMPVPERALPKLLPVPPGRGD